MKKNFKRWLALTLAVIMVMSTCMVSSDNFLWATDGMDEPVTVSEEDVTVADETAAESGAETPDTGETETPAEEPQEIVVPQKEVPAEEPAKEESVTETPSGDVSLGQEVEVLPSEEAEDTYNVVFHRPAIEGEHFVYGQMAPARKMLHTQTANMSKR